MAAEQAARLAYREERRRAQRRSTVAFAVERERRKALRELRAAGAVTQNVNCPKRVPVYLLDMGNVKQKRGGAR